MDDNTLPQKAYDKPALTTLQARHEYTPANDVSKTTMVMSSREIAKVMGKHHKNVKRDIEVMLSKLGMGTLKFEHTYVDLQNKQKYIEYQLPRFEFEVLITGYDVKRRAAVINRWYELESGHHSSPLSGQQKDIQPDANPLYQISISEKALEMARTYGFSGNAALISADNATRHMIGFSPLEAMGQKQLIAPVQAMTFTPTQLGHMMSPPQNPQQVNKLLAAVGLQNKTDHLWLPTDSGLTHCEILDIGKSHNNGTPVKQVKWYKSVLNLLTPIKTTTSTAPEDQTQAKPKEVGAKTDIDPIQRQQKRKRNRYELDDYFSLVELGEFIGKSRQHVVTVLEKNKIIKWVGQGKKGKYLLTEKGWRYGLMYDPTEQAFHNYNSKRLTTSNAQPVLAYDILTFF